MTYGFSAVCFLVHRNERMASLVLKMKHFWREGTYKDTFSIFSEKIGCDLCFVHLGHCFPLFSMEPELLGGPSIPEVAKSAMVALQHLFMSLCLYSSFLSPGYYAEPSVHAPPMLFPTCVRVCSLF